MPTYKLDFTNVDQLESWIHVNFDRVVTVPVLDGNDADTGIVLYVGVTALGQLARGVVPADRILDVAGRLALADEGGA